MPKILKKDRASRSLLRQVIFEGLEGFFSLFFSCLVSTSFSMRFFLDFEGVWEAKMRPQIVFWRGFWDVFLAPSFRSFVLPHFDDFFNAQFLENSDFT